MKRLIAAVVGGLLVMTTAAYAHEYKVGDLEIMHPVVRATPPNAPVSAGYMVIKNSGTEADRLIGGSADFAGKTEIHEMTMDGDVMKMRELKDGLVIPAGGEVRLQPGGFHIMFMKLKAQLAVGEKRKGTLRFEKAGTVDIEFTVEEIKPSGTMDHSGHEKSSMNHGLLGIGG